VNPRSGRLDPEGKVLYSTRHFSTLPNRQLAEVDLNSGVSTVLPLSQASDGTFDPAGKVLYFTRLAFQGSSTKRYQGGTAQVLWKFALGSSEAVPLTADFPAPARILCSGRTGFISLPTGMGR